MKFQVKLTRNAKLEIESVYLWLKNVNSAYADKWFRDLMNTICKKHTYHKSIKIGVETIRRKESLRKGCI